LELQAAGHRERARSRLRYRRVFGDEGAVKAELRFVLLLVCFFVSGFAALIYQTAWTRQFAFVFGTSELAIATVLAAYMGGLAAGAAAGVRLARRVRRPVLAYGLLELGIALAALAVPAAIGAATALYVAIFGGGVSLPESGGLAPALFTLGSCFAILMIPTGLMGATLPMLARHAVRRESEIGPRIGVLYATNTLGAVAGTAVAGFALLPALGLERTVWVGVAANGLVFLAAVSLARGAAGVGQLPRARADRVLRGPGHWILPLVLVSGAVSFTYEVLWSRLLGHLLGGSVYGFATMLASFLAGIALGSAVASRVASSPERAARGFRWAQFGTAALSFLTFAALDRMPALSRAIAATAGSHLTADAAVAAATLLPAALCIGATFPLAVRVLAQHPGDAGPESARVYAWNTLGAIAGAVGAGFFVVPLLGYAGTLTLGVVANLALGLAVKLPRASSWRRLAAVSATGLACLLLLPPDPPWNLLRASAIPRDLGPGRVVHYGVGRSATVLLVEQNGAWRLRASGLSESRVLPRGGHAGGGSIPQWLGAVSSLARPEARSMLVVGLGGGVLLEALPSMIESVDVVELEPEVIRANRAIASQRRRDPLSDARVTLTVNDARSSLLLTEKRYDAIVSQPSHPWTGGASHLYTREFFELVRERLAPAGILVQWMALSFVDDSLLRTLVATLVEVFPHVRVYHPDTGGLLFLASDRPLAVEANAGRAIASAPDDFAELGVFGPEDVAAALVLDEEGARAFSAGAPVNSDDRNLLEMRSLSLAREEGLSFQPDELLGPLDPLARPMSGLDRVYLVRRLLARGFTIRARRLAEATADPAQRAAALGLVALATGQPSEGRLQLERALELELGAREARAALLRLRRRAVLAGEGPAAVLASVAGDPEAAVLEGWRADAERDWGAVRALEPRLARLDPRDPLFPDAVRLRAGWRLSEGGSPLAREAVGLVDQLIPVTDLVADLALRARAAAAAGDRAGAVVTLFEVASRLKPVPADAAVAREALVLLWNLPRSAGTEEERKRLEAMLRVAVRGVVR
jgi:spermidine synthase